MTALRILVCTKRDLPGSLVLNALLPRLTGDQVMVLLSDKTRPVENAVPELAEMKFLERELPVDTLFPLIDRLNQADGPTGGPTGALATFDGCAARYGVPVKVISDINGVDGEALVRDFAPDLIISARFSLIFKSNIFQIPRFGTYNIHPGALPRYAGLFAPFRCIVEGAESIGCTLHQVDSGIDTGPVVGIGELPVTPGRSLLWHIVNTYRPGIELFVEMLEVLRGGGVPATWIQDRSLRRYASLPGAEAFRTFHDKGFRLFDSAEYMQIMGGFLAPGTAMPFAMPGQGHDATAEMGGGRCFCAPA